MIKMFAIIKLCLSCAALIAITTPALGQDSAPRQRPGEAEVPTKFPPFIYESVPDINSSASDFVAVPDRWRQFYVGQWYDPYNQNVLKGDIPIFGGPGEEWFFNADIISDTSFDALRIPVPVGGASTNHSHTINTFGDGDIQVFAQTVATSFSLIKGNTTFKPPDFEFRFAPVFTFNHANASETGILRLDPSDGTGRDISHIGFQELFFDAHITNLSERYDFISSRVGIQKFQSDFRGFIYSDEEPGARLFGNYDNNKLQYNLAWFTRLDKDTNTGLNTNFDLRHEDVLVANLYRQDAPVHGHTLQANVLYRSDRAGDYATHFDSNGVQRRPAAIGDERPKNIDSVYLGLTGDGHFDRLNTTSAFYFVTGTESHNSIAGRQQDIQAGMAALEMSYDIDWIRLRTSFMWASGDKDPYDDTAGGFDSVFDVPNFAGGDLSYWQRNAIPLIGGGDVFLVNKRSLLPNLRAGKEEGQSNFVNPGLRLFNTGADFELTPKLKLVTNATYLQFDDVAVLEAVRQDATFSRDIGIDLSAGFIFRPWLNNNVKVQLGAATLLPAQGLKGLYGDTTLYSVFTNLILQY